MRRVVNQNVTGCQCQPPSHHRDIAVGMITSSSKRSAKTDILTEQSPPPTAVTGVRF